MVARDDIIAYVAVCCRDALVHATPKRVTGCQNNTIQYNTINQYNTIRYNNFCLTKDKLIAVKLFFLVTPGKSDKTTN